MDGGMSTQQPGSSNFRDYFSGHAGDYASGRPVYPPSLVMALAERCRGHELALDCGCGSGQLSTLLAERFERVVAIDPSAPQIAHALPHPRVEYRVAPAEHSGVAGQSADLVVAAQAVHWFDQPAFWQEVRRVARPGALCALVTYNLLHIEPRIDACIRHFHDVVLQEHWPPERASVINDYRDIAFPFPELAMPPLEIVAEWQFEGLINYLKTWSALKLAEKKLPESPLVAVRRELEALWGESSQRRTLRWPLTVRCGCVEAAKLRA
jgi:SAM-dependent methyltransferase